MKRSSFGPNAVDSRTKSSTGAKTRPPRGEAALEGDAAIHASQRLSEDDQAALKGILAVLKTKAGHDFRCYKPSTLLRRIQRRVNMTRSQSLSAYLHLLQAREEEVVQLRKELLIGVTDFFRQIEAWRILNHKVIPHLIRKANAEHPIRAWVAGCANGKEAYSLAILLMEAAEASKKKIGIQIFATDADETALEAARAAVFSKEEVKNISRARLRRFFTRKDGSYQLIKRIRGVVVFAPQNLTSDPPFSNLDLISCRNLLIYLNQQAQKEVVALFHYALRDGGFLFLGNAETVTGYENLFEPVSRKWRIYRRIGMVRQPGLELPLRSAGKRLVGKRPIPGPSRRSSVAQAAQRSDTKRASSRAGLQGLEDELNVTRGQLQDTIERLEASNEELKASNEEVIAANEELQSANEELETSKEELQTLNEELNTVNSLLQEKIDELEHLNNDLVNLLSSTNIATVFLDRELRVQRFTPAVTGLLNLIATDIGRPITDIARRFIDETLIQDARKVLADLTPLAKEVHSEDGKWFIRRVAPYRTQDDRIEGVIITFVDVDDLKQSQEALRCSRQVIEATSNRLATVLSSITDAYLVLDDQWRLIEVNAVAEKEAFAQPASELLGRVIWEIFPQTVGGEVYQQYHLAVERGQPVHYETRSRILNKWWEIHAYPGSGRLEVYMREITSRKQAEEALKRQAALIDLSPDGIIVRKLDGTITFWSHGAEKLYGWTKQEAIGQRTHDLFQTRLSKPPEEIFKQLRKSGVWSGELVHRTKDGGEVVVQSWWLAQFDGDGEITEVLESNVDMSERKRAEVQLEYLASFPERNPHPVLEVDLDGRIRYMNPATLQLFPDLPDKGLAHPWLADWATAVRPFLEGLTTTGIRDVTIGERAYQQASYYIAQDRLVRIYGLDITERKRAEEVLRENERRMNRTEEIAHLGSWELDLQNNRLSWSDEVYRIFGLKPQEFGATYEAFLEAVHPDDRQAVDAAYSGSLRAGRDTYEIEHRIVRKSNGEVRIVHEKCEHVRDQSGRIIRSVGMVHDVTERKKMEEALRESEERLRLAQTNANIGVWDWMPQTGRLNWAPELEALYGVAPGTIKTYEDWLHRVHPDDIARIEAERDEAIAKRQPFDLEFRILHGSGEIRWISDKGKAIYNAAGEIVRATGINIDISRIKRTEQELKALNETLEQQVTERTALAENRAAQLRMLAAKLTQAEHQERERLARVLHDHLQQLLVGAKINLGILRGRLGDCEQRQALLQIDELLDQSLTASRSLTAELSPPILQENKLARTLQWLGRWAKENYGLTTQEELDEQADLPVLEVRILLFQAVRELLLNIVKHAGTNRASIKMRRLGTDRVQIMVSDEGVGFDPAQRRSQEAQSQTGTGLGLFSIRERLELLGGHMEIDSGPGRGTQVTLVVPCRRADKPTVAAARPEEKIETLVQIAASARVPRDEKVIRVLLADDHAVVRDGLTQLLQMHEGIVVVGQASDGQEAVQMALRLQPDIVLMDVTMPQLNGADATRMILQQLPQTRIIALSMHAREDIVEQMTAAGAVRYLTKTAPPEVLIAAIRECAARPLHPQAEQSPP